MIYLFVCVHPDDLEFNCANLIHHLVLNNNEVHILSLTKGEFGIFDPKWKGPRLSKIRVKELIKASNISGIAENRVHFGDIIDGFVRFDRININHALNHINKIRPDIIFSPEAYYTYYWHPDHINCGRICFYLAKLHPNMLEKPIIGLYFYTTSRPNFFWPFDSTSHATNVLYQHQSQWWVLKWNKLFYPIEKHNRNKRLLGSWNYVEKYRKVPLHTPEPRSNLIERAIIGLISKLNIINPPDSHFKANNSTSAFGKEVERLRKIYHFKD